MKVDISLAMTKLVTARWSDVKPHIIFGVYVSIGRKCFTDTFICLIRKFFKNKRRQTKFLDIKCKLDMSVHLCHAR